MTSAVDTKHPDYSAAYDDWKMMRDAIAGARTVKEGGEIYLPKPGGFVGNTNEAKMYDAYKLRAQFPKITGPTVRGMNGVIHRTEVQIEMPDSMEDLWEKATPDGLTLDALYRRITDELLQTGRYSLLVDAPTEADALRPGALPLIAGYRAEALINWAPPSKQDFYVFDETEKVRDGFEWKDEESYRVLELVDGVYKVTRWVKGLAGTEPDPKVNALEPRKKGGGKFERIPVVVIGPNGLGPAIDEVPLLGVAEAAFAAYRLDADYRWQLFMSGQETLFCYGIEPDQRPALVGAGVIHSFSDANAKAEYVGPSGAGIAAHRLAIQDERMNAIEAGARLFAMENKGVEAEGAKRIRYTAQTATLTSIALNAAQGLERALKSVAEFMGQDATKVVVKPNLDFVDTKLSPAEVKDLVASWQLGGFSYQTLYENLKRGGVANEERTAEEEQALIEDEMPEPTDPIVDPNAPPEAPGAVSQ